MSHFTVLVLGDDVEEQLAPYDENIRVAPRRSYVDAEDVERARDHYLAQDVEKPEGFDPDKPESFWESWSGQPLRLDQVGNPYVLSSYNESSKWDWYTIGGRWAGALLLKPGAKAVTAPDLSGWQWDQVSAEEKAEILASPCADQAYKGDIDIDGMRQKYEDAAGKQWDTVNEAIKDTPPATPWATFMAQAQGDEITREEARERYGNQERVKAFREAGVGGFMGPGLEEFEVERDLYVHRARLQAVPGFATLYFGEWFEPGSMGWFGMSTDSPETRQSYGEFINKLIDDAADDVLFSMVDCHI